MKVAIAPIVLSTATLGLIFGVTQNAQAALITGVTASTDMGTLDGDITRTVNGAGLPGNTPSLTGAHQTANDTNSWLGNQSTGNITFNLNGSYSLAGFSLWNHNNSTLVGIKDVTVQSSTDGTTFTTITGAPTQFAIGPSSSGGPFNPEVFSFSPVTASHVRFVVTSNWGGLFAGLAEAQFNGTTPPPQPVPEPSSLLALLAFGLAGVGFRKLM